MSDPTNPIEAQLTSALDAEAAQVSATPRPDKLMARLAGSPVPGRFPRRLVVRAAAAAAVFVVVGVGAAAALTGNVLPEHSVKVGSEPGSTTTLDEPTSVVTEPRPNTTVKRDDEPKPTTTTHPADPSTTVKPPEPTIKPPEPTTTKPREEPTTVKPTTTTVKPETTTVKPTTTTEKPATTTTKAPVEFTANQALEASDHTPPVNEYWGTANPGTPVKVTSELSEPVSVITNGDGRWSARVEFPAATVGQTVTVKVWVKVGDTWVLKKQFSFAVVAP